MKRTWLVMIGLMVLKLSAQTDTIFTKKHTKIPCKIEEVNESELKYRLADHQTGPVFVVDRASVLRFTLSNGYTELVTPDELSLEHEHQEILLNRRALKFHPFGIAFDHLSLAYEKVIKVGMNLDIEAGYIHSDINNRNERNYNPWGPVSYSGAYLKPGIKFFLGQDFSVKGLKYAHPLKGRYIRIDLALAYVSYRGLRREYYHYPPYPSPSPTSVTVVTSDLNTSAYGMIINYGRQFILGNLFTLDYYAGMGFTGQSFSYTNPDFLKMQRSAGYYRDDMQDNGNYHAFFRIPGIGMSFSAGFRLGYILPAKQVRKK